MLKTWAVTVALLVFVQNGDVAEYVDEARRFRFQYPAVFGTPSTGTNDGFEDRVAAIRFSTFSSGAAGLGGEAALTRGFPMVDMQAVGGLYDAIALEVFPAPLRRQVVQALPRLTATNFCQMLGQAQHLEPQHTALSSFTAQQRAAVVSVDQMRHVNPRVVRCVVASGTVTFDKETAFQQGGPRQHVYGAVRFLEPPDSTFQIVRAGAAPDASVLDQMTALVNSWRRF